MIVQSSLTRPADTTAYAANDNIGQVTTAANHSWTIDVNAGTGEAFIFRARVITNKTSVTPRLRLHLYSTAPTAIADNAACTVLWANRASYLGAIEFPPMVSSGTGSDTSIAALEMNPLSIMMATGGIQTVSAGRATATLYGQLETLDAFTPDSGQIFLVQIAEAAFI